MVEIRNGCGCTIARIPEVTASGYARKRLALPNWYQAAAVGKPKEKIRIEPVTEPIPEKTPAPVEAPSETPSEPVEVPA